jgi:hypothetical protein
MHPLLDVQDGIDVQSLIREHGSHICKILGAVCSCSTGTSIGIVVSVLGVAADTVNI